jgi:hypothetical protein
MVDRGVGRSNSLARVYRVCYVVRGASQDSDQRWQEGLDTDLFALLTKPRDCNARIRGSKDSRVA